RENFSFDDADHRGGAWHGHLARVSESSAGSRWHDALGVSLFVTGTDTGVGKTHTVTQLLRLLRAAGSRCAGMKPICCGDRRDAGLLQANGSEGLTIDEVNPIWLKTPVAPFAAALVEKVEIDIERIVAAFSALQKR